MGQRQRVIEGFRRMADHLEDRWKVEVIEVAGMTWRGFADLYPRGFINHHTASRRGSGRAAALPLVIDGSPRGIPGALANWHCERGARARLRIIASGYASHAGKGSWPGCGRDTSRYMIGLEWENDGLGEPPHPDEDWAMLALNVEAHIEFNLPVPNLIEHREWARYGRADGDGPWTSRKIDRTEYRGPTWRARVAAAIAEGLREQAAKGDWEMAWEFWQGDKSDRPAPNNTGKTAVYLVNTQLGFAYWVRTPASMASLAQRLKVPTAVHTVPSTALDALLNKTPAGV